MKRPNASMNKENAFTLIELMVTLIIMSIVILVAIPAFDNQVRNNRSLALGEDFAAALNLARSEAVKRGSHVVLCASNPAQTACGTSWANGWMVIPDAAAETSTSVSVTSGDEIRIWQSPADAEISAERRAAGSSSGTATTFVRFTGMGTLARIEGDPTMVSLSAQITDCTGRGQQIDISVAGSLRVRRVDCTATE